MGASAAALLPAAPWPGASAEACCAEREPPGAGALNRGLAWPAVTVMQRLLDLEPDASSLLQDKALLQIHLSAWGYALYRAQALVGLNLRPGHLLLGDRATSLQVYFDCNRVWRACPAAPAAHKGLFL